MEFLLSNIAPMRFARRDTASCFTDLLKTADSIRIATGYISTDALIDLKKIIEVNKKPYLDLIIGMHGFEGFTHSQYEMAKILDNFLKENNYGSVKVCTVFKFHGKLYTFSNQSCPYSGILGSSNLNSAFDSQSLYEADLLIKEGLLG